MPKAHEPRRAKPIRSPSWPDDRIGDSGVSNGDGDIGVRNGDDYGIGDDGGGSVGKGLNGSDAGAGIVRQGRCKR